jgi:hypothetical protein
LQSAEVAAGVALNGLSAEDGAAVAGWCSSQGRLGCFDGGAAGAELLGFLAGVFERRAGVGIDQIARLDVGESVPQEATLVLCFQQSPGNSTGPQVDVSSPLLRHRPLDGDIGQLDAATRSQHAHDLGKDGVLVGNQVDDAV